MKRVLVIGGGVSGLVAAGELARKGYEVVLLEAKDRLGGRILTRRNGASIAELGAEFIHGCSAQMLQILRDKHIELIDASERNRLAKSGHLKKVDLWERVGKVIGKIDPHSRDLSFADWLAHAKLDPETNEMAMAFVEGFNAADARLIGAHSLLRAEYASEKNEGEKQARVKQGYDALISSLQDSARRSGVKIQLSARAQLIKWRRGHVEIHARLEPGDPGNARLQPGANEGQVQVFTADAAIITLPLGVLKSGRVVFEPSLVHKREAVDNLKFGNVAKLTFIFGQPWWQNNESHLEQDFGFIHSFSEPIPTWWSDSRAPTLVGWAAGPKGERMLDLPPPKLKQIGLEVMAKVFSRPIPNIENDLLAFEFHDWRSDPDIGGAYSYIPVNGLDLPKALAAPIEDTLYFAGEATAMDAQMGTVSGALESAFRVVEEIV